MFAGQSHHARDLLRIQWHHHRAGTAFIHARVILIEHEFFGTVEHRLIPNDLPELTDDGSVHKQSLWRDCNNSGEIASGNPGIS